MDDASLHVLQFLTASREILTGSTLYGGGGLWQRIVSRGIRADRPQSRVSIYGQSTVAIAFGVYAEIAKDKWLEFEVEVIARKDTWEIDTSVWVDLYPEGDGQRILRDFPIRRASTLDECLVQVRAAVDDLAICDDVLDELPETRSRK